MSAKFLGIVLFLFSFVILTTGLAFAEHECTRQVSSSDGTKFITVDCSSSHTVTSEDFWNRYLFSTLVSNLRNSVHWGAENFQARLAEIFSGQDHSREIAADMRDKEQEAIEDQQAKHQQEVVQLEDARERQAMQKQQQQDSMQGLRDTGSKSRDALQSFSYPLNINYANIEPSLGPIAQSVVQGTHKSPVPVA